ncbi:MAG: hypothetical protein RXQ93_07635 [Caldisphaera sp.]
MRKEVNVECYELEIDKNAEKDDTLEHVKTNIVYKGTYNDFIKQVTDYFSSARSSLDRVEIIYRQGAEIRPQFKGHKKSFEKPAIGLAISIVSYDKTRDELKFKSLNADEVKLAYKYEEDIAFKVVKDDLYNNIAWFIDLSQVYPFSIVRLFKILYNENMEKLITFLKSMYGKYGEALNETIKHLKVPSKPSISMEDVKDEDVFIILYRCQRTFVSSVLTPGILREAFSTGINKLIISNTVSYMLTYDEDVAFYYSMILNYLVYRAKMLGGKFILNQYGRPVEVIKNTDLEWRNKDWQIKVAELSKNIHKEARSLLLRYLGLPDNLTLFELIDNGLDIEAKNSLGERVGDVLLTMVREIKEIDDGFKIINNHVDQSKLREAIRMTLEENDTRSNNRGETKLKRDTKNKDNNNVNILDFFK